MDIQIIPPPTPDSQGMLTFVVLRLDPLPSDRSGILTELTFDIIAQHAQYFAGYISQEEKEEVCAFALGASEAWVECGLGDCGDCF